MRETIVQEALRRLAAEAAIRLTSLVATGEELPFDVAESSGEHTFYRYVPLTDLFVREHADELRSLPSFGPACSAVDAAGIAASYLEARGERVPEDPVARAEQMLIAFVCRLWQGATEFTLERSRLEAALHELEAEARDVSDADILLVPLVGLQMPLARLDLPNGVQIVRADTIEAPPEVTRSEGMGRDPWEPQFLALVEREEDAGSAPAMRMLRELISVLRMFKEGGVGLGPHAFTPTGEKRWRRIPTGVPVTRPGGYRLSEAEASELAEFARRLEAGPDPEGALAWAVTRFEMGCDRLNVLEALSDHLLAMRALFEGSGPVGANLPMRVAALIAEPPERPEAYEKLQGCFELERLLMAGQPFNVGSAIELAAWLEDAARAVIRGAALGQHGTDVAASADESLVATGLEAGEGSLEQMGGPEEWEPPSEKQPAPEPSEEETSEVPLPESEEIRIHAASAYAEDGGDDSYEEEGVHFEAQSIDHEESDEEEETVRTSIQRDWLSEVSEAEGETLEWPAPAAAVSRARTDWRGGEEGEEPLDEPRVRHLFPVPDDTDWEIGELDYDRDESRVS